jgi:hypothetical protein
LKLTLSSAIIAAASATTLLLITAMTVTTIAYAQPNTSNSKACPEGFHIERGTCVGEPTLKCESDIYPPERISLIDGECLLLDHATAGCISPDGEPVTYDIFDDRCENSTGQLAPNAVLTCGQYEALGWKLQRIDNSWQCVGYTSLGIEPTPICDTPGTTLNEQTGLCEIKPGNNNKTNRA